MACPGVEALRDRAPSRAVPCARGEAMGFRDDGRQVSFCTWDSPCDSCAEGKGSAGRPGRPAVFSPFLCGYKTASSPAARQGTNVLQEPGSCSRPPPEKAVEEYYGTRASRGTGSDLCGWRSRSRAALHEPLPPAARRDRRSASPRYELTATEPDSRPSTQWACPGEGAARARGTAPSGGGRPHARGTQAAPPTHPGPASAVVETPPAPGLCRPTAVAVHRAPTETLSAFFS